MDNSQYIVLSTEPIARKTDAKDVFRIANIVVADAKYDSILLIKFRDIVSSFPQQSGHSLTKEAFL